VGDAKDSGYEAQGDRRVAVQSASAVGSGVLLSECLAAHEIDIMLENRADGELGIVQIGRELVRGFHGWRPFRIATFERSGDCRRFFPVEAVCSVIFIPPSTSRRRTLSTNRQPGN
jgi:hypothetical protein